MELVGAIVKMRKCVTPHKLDCQNLEEVLPIPANKTLKRINMKNTYSQIVRKLKDIAASSSISCIEYAVEIYLTACYILNIYVNVYIFYARHVNVFWLVLFSPICIFFIDLYYT